MTSQWVIALLEMSIDITMGNDISRVIHCDVTMHNDVAICTYHGITMHNDVAMNLFYYVLLITMPNYYIAISPVKSLKLYP